MPIAHKLLLILPETLLACVLQALLAFAQGGQLPLGQVSQLASDALPNPPIFSLPQSSSPLTISVAFCSVPEANSARFFVTNNSAISIPGSNGGADVFEVVVGSNGTGNVILNSASNGGVLAIDVGSMLDIFQVAVSDTEPVHNIASTLPLLGDTTSNQALVFSPPFSPVTPTQPVYPNYTLPVANLSFPDPPPTSSVPNFTLIVGPTSSFPFFNLSDNANLGGLPVTSCALQNSSNIEGLIPNTDLDSSLVYRDENGWRVQWLVQGLQPLTNYTAYVVQDGTQVSGPINFLTKSVSFSCHLVHSLPYCPLVSYSVPLTAPPSPLTAHDASTLPDSLTQPLLSYMTNFTTMLLTFACGRDWYSPLQSCASCQAAYRTWLCAVTFPRCGEAPPSITMATHNTAQTAQAVFPALVLQASNSTPRNPNLPPFPSSYDILLPCLETCNAVDRACPNFLGFACPVPKFNADASYGVGYVDGDVGTNGIWTQGRGTTDAAQDRWGNIWCAGG